MPSLDDIIQKARERFRAAKYKAKLRGIPFLLSFDEWWDIWSKSGHWLDRGVGRNKYQMARKGDEGGYEIGNVRICLAIENRAEQRSPNKGRKFSVEFKAKISAVQKGKKLSLEHKKHISMGLKGKKQSVPWTVERRAKISEANRHRIVSEITRKKMSIAGKGRRHTLETCAKISATKRAKETS